MNYLTTVPRDINCHKAASRKPKRPQSLNLPGVGSGLKFGGYRFKVEVSG